MRMIIIQMRMLPHLCFVLLNHSGVDRSIGPRAIIQMRMIPHFHRIFKALSIRVFQLIYCPTFTLRFNVEM